MAPSTTRSFESLRARLQAKRADRARPFVVQNRLRTRTWLTTPAGRSPSSDDDAAAEINTPFFDAAIEPHPPSRLRSVVAGVIAAVLIAGLLWVVYDTVRSQLFDPAVDDPTFTPGVEISGTEADASF